MTGYGFWGGDLRQPQIRLTMGNLILALVKQNAKTGVVAATGTETDTTFPKIEALYTLKLGSITIIPFLSYQTYDEVVLATDKDYSIDSYLYGLSVKAAVGPGYVKGQIWANTNGREWGDVFYRGGFKGADKFQGGDVQDEDGLGYAITAGYKISDTISFEAGYGHSEYEIDRPGTWEDDACAYYAMLPIEIAKGFWVVPEIGKIDKDTHTVNGKETEEGDMTYYGAVWKIHF